jgi:hypothetical protein
MATVNFSIPEEIRSRFNRAFEGRNKSQIVAELLLRAVEEEAVNRKRMAAIDALLRRRTQRVSATQAEVSKARRAGRP